MATMSQPPWGPLGIPDAAPPSAGWPAPTASGPSTWPSPTASGPSTWPAPGSVAAPPAPPAPAVPPGALDYPVMFNPAAAWQVWKDAKRTRTSRLVSLLISAGISAAVWWFFRDQLGDWLWWMVGLSLALPTIQLLIAIVQVVRHRKVLAGVHDGLALGVGRGGLYLHGTYVPWAELGQLQALPPRFGGTSTLRVEPRGGQALTLPLDYLSAMPATLDGAIRALSGGRAWIDVSALDA